MDAVVKRKIRSPRRESNPTNSDRPIDRLSYHGSHYWKGMKQFSEAHALLKLLNHELRLSRHTATIGGGGGAANKY
jgi:hypothetical protein